MGDKAKQPGDHTEVRQALKRACAAGEDGAVVFHVRGKGGSELPSPSETEQLAEALVKKAVNSSGHEPKRKTIYQNLGSMVVQGAPELLLKILDQPEVASASMNPPTGGPVELIQPVNKSAAKASGWA